jgi:hypothetical protein
MCVPILVLPLRAANQPIVPISGNRPAFTVDV